MPCRRAQAKPTFIRRRRRGIQLLPEQFEFRRPKTHSPGLLATRQELHASAKSRAVASLRAAYSVLKAAPRCLPRPSENAIRLARVDLRTLSTSTLEGERKLKQKFQKRKKQRKRHSTPRLAATSRKGTWCSGITPAQHAGGPGFNPQCVHFGTCQTSASSKTTLLAGLEPGSQVLG